MNAAKTILIAGGTGFIGRVLNQYLTQKGHSVKILSRNPQNDNEVKWNAEDIDESWVNELENLDVLINLSGKNINCRFTEKNKALITTSRVQSTELLGKAIDQCISPPKIWMNSSTTSIYKSSLDVAMSEDQNEFGDDFEKEVAILWEEAFYKYENPSTRKIVLRTSLVFGPKDGAFVPLKQLTRFGLGGTQGKGTQMVSWIHELDFARAVEHLIHSDEAKGAYNFCSPYPVSNRTLMRAFRKQMGMPIGLPGPEFLVRIGAFFIGTEADLLLKSRHVIPKRLVEQGFSFKFDTIDSALADLIG